MEVCVIEERKDIRWEVRRNDIFLLVLLELREKIEEKAGT